MKTARRRILVVAVTAAQLTLASGLFVWRVDGRSGGGWAGLAYLGPIDLDLSGLQKEPGDLDLLLEIPGAVLLVVAGSPAAEAGLEAGEVIESIGGVAVTDREGLRGLEQRSRPGDEVVYDLGYRRVRVRLVSRLAGSGALPALVAGGMLGTALLLVGGAVAWRRPSSAARILHLLSSVGAAFFLLAAASRLDVPDLGGLTPFGSDPFAWVVWGGELLLLVAATDLILHLSLVFPRARPVAARGPWLFAALHLLPFLPLAALPALYFLLGLSASSPSRRALVTGLAALPAVLVCLGILLVYSLWTCGALYRNWRDGDAGERRRAAWPLWGIATALAAALWLTLAVALVMVVSREAGAAAARWIVVPNEVLALLVPLSFAAGVLEWRPELVGRLLGTSLVWAGVAYFVLAGGFALLVPGRALAGVVPGGMASVTVAAAAVLGALAVPVSRRLRRFVGRRLG